MTQPSTLLREAKASISLAIPLLLSEWLYALNFFVSTWIAAQLGRESLAAIALVQSSYFFLFMMISGISAATSILVAQDLGAKNLGGIRHAFAQGLVLIIFLAMVAGIILWALPYFLPLLGIKDKEIVVLSTRALHAFLWSLVPFAFLIMIEKFLIGLHRTRLVLFFTTFVIPISILANYSFALGKFGFPRCGLAGFGYGHAIAYSLLFLIFIIFTFTDKELRSYRLFSAFKNFSEGTKYLIETWRVGWPLGVMFSIEVGAVLVFTFLMSTLGTHVLAAYQIARQYLVLALVTLFALTESAAVRVGYATGEDNRLSVKRAFYLNIGIALIFMSILSGIYLCAKPLLISLDINIHDPKNSLLILHTKHFLTAIAILVFVDGIRNVSAGGLRGLKDSKGNLYSSILGYWCIGLPLAYLFGHVLHLGGEGLWIGFILGIAVSAVFLQLRFQRLFKRVELKKLLI